MGSNGPKQPKGASPLVANKSLEQMTFLEEAKKDKKKAAIRSQQSHSNMSINNNLVKKHKKLQEQ